MEIPKGLCQCGCGGKTQIAKTTDNRYGQIKGQPNKFLSGHNRKGNLFHRQRSGKTIMLGKYPALYVPEHPRGKNNGCVHEHILIAEKALGKFLPPKAVVHHHTPEQLVVCQDLAYHNLLHRRTRAFRACGNANWRRCRYCREYDDIRNLKTPGSDVYHSECMNAYYRVTK